MHEFAATQGILAVALEEMERAGAQRITAIRVVVGELASVIDDSVQFYFELLSEDTAAAGARLSFRRVFAEYRCNDCEHTFSRTPGGGYSCPKCQGTAVLGDKGREFFIESLEVE